jgi:hypothetical protein
LFFKKKYTCAILYFFSSFSLVVHTSSDSHTDNDDSGLISNTTSDGLREAFAKYGEVIQGMSLKFEL